MAPSACSLGWIPDFPDLPVWHRVDRVVPSSGLRNFDRTRISRTAEIGAAARIADVRSVDDHCVVVQAGRKGRGCHSPESIRLLHHVHYRTTPAVQSDLGRLRSIDAHLDPALRVHAWIFGAPNVAGR